MTNYTSDDLQDISANFRNVARRLSRTDYSQCDANLKRFMNMLKNQELINKYIEKHNTVAYAIDEIIKQRDWISPFEISPIMDEEISFEYQILQYALDKFDGDFTKLYGTHIYTSTKSTVNDEMQKFIEHIIDPLIDYISEYLRNCYESQVKEEAKEKPMPMGITANYSTVVVANKVDGDISNVVTINEQVRKEALDIVDSIRETLEENKIENESDIMDMLKLIEGDIQANNKPKKGFFAGLKALCGGSAAVITLVNALMKLFESA